MERAVELMEMLEARDRRARRQRELLEQYRLPLISFTMNIAGPVKNGPLIRRGFRLGRRLLLEQLERMGVPCVWLLYPTPSPRPAHEWGMACWA